MRIAALFAVVALTAGFVVLPASAEERPSDPFGNHTTELNAVLDYLGARRYLSAFWFE
jgi:hypothetical protein